MVNLIGDRARRRRRARRAGRPPPPLRQGAPPGRKLGHVTVVAPDDAELAGPAGVASSRPSVDRPRRPRHRPKRADAARSVPVGRECRARSDLRAGWPGRRCGAWAPRPAGCGSRRRPAAAPRPSACARRRPRSTCERPGQRLAGAEQLGGAPVGVELPAAGDGHLEQAGRERGQDRGGDEQDDGAGAVVVVAAAEHRAPHRHVGDEGDGGGDRGGDRADQDVAVLHVHQLVGQHALAPGRGAGTLSRPLVTQTTAWRGLRPVAKALGCSAGLTAIAGHRQVGPLGQLADDGVAARALVLVDQLGAAGVRASLSLDEERDADGDERRDQADHGARAAAEQGRRAPTNEAAEGRRAAPSSSSCW